MYIDTDFNTLLPSLPNAYKHTSNFDYLTDDELKLFNVFKVESFVKDEAYQDLQAILGTTLYPFIEVSIIANQTNPSVEVQVVIDRANAIDKVKELTGHQGDYATVQDAVLDKPIHVAPLATVREPDVFEYDYENSYVFVVLGTSELSVLNESSNPEAPGMGRFKYALTQNDPDQMPSVKVGDVLEQKSGFSGVVESVDESNSIIKLVRCVGVDLLDRTMQLLCKSDSVEDVFCFELYLKVISVNGGKWSPPENYPEELGEICIRVLHTNPAIEYKDNFQWGVRGDESAMVKREMRTQDLAVTNVRSMNEFGRFA